VADIVEMRSLAADYDTERDDGIMVCSQFLDHYRNLNRAEHADHRRAVDARLGGHFTGAGQQRVADLGVPGAGDNSDPQPGRVNPRHVRHAGAPAHKAPPNSPGRCTDSWKSSSPARS